MFSACSRNLDKCGQIGAVRVSKCDVSSRAVL